MSSVSFGKKMTVLAMAAMCSVGVVEARPLFTVSSEVRAKISADEAFGSLLNSANLYVGEKALDPDKLVPKGRSLSHARNCMNHTIGRTLTNWMEALGWAWTIKGDEKYAEAGVRLLMDTVALYPVTQEWMSARGTMAGGRGDFMRGLAMGYHFFGDRLTAEQRAAFAKCARGYVEHFLGEANNPKTWWYGPHNFNGVCGGAAGMLTLVLDGEDKIWSELREQCAAVMERWFDASIDVEGAYVEGAGYSQYGYANSLQFAWFWREAGGRDLFKHPRIKKLSQFYALSMLPGRTEMDARNDSNYVTVGFECMLLSVFNQDGLASWLLQRSKRKFFPLGLLLEDRMAKPVSPEDTIPKDMLFPGRGLCIWRTGWGADDVMFSTEAGPYYRVTHNQSDKGHFTLYAYGDMWAIDPGYGNDNQFKDSRCHTLAHSCVLIDGGGQARSGCGTGTNGKILAFENDERMGYALVDATEAYQRNVNNQPGVGARKALRHNMFVRPFQGAPAYAVVFDDIEKDDEPHDFTWQMMAKNDKAVTCREGGATLRTRDGDIKSRTYVWTPIEKGFSGACTWTFEIEEDGEYEVALETRSCGTVHHTSDSFVVCMDELKPVHYHMPSTAAWTWSFVRDGLGNKEPVAYSLKAGKHVLSLKTRERGAAAAGMILYKKVKGPNGELLPSKCLVALPADVAEVSGKMERCQRDIAEVQKSSMELYVSSIEDIGTPSVDIYAPQDGQAPTNIPRIRGTVRAVNPYFSAVLLPLLDTAERPEVVTKRNGKAVEITVRWKDHADVIQWDGAGKPTLKR